ncbi:bifunctional ADP-dependent NAD(P)H-hydrate dehydratase/NAD(P)H-hydrate epimerase [Corynebacterium glyciniphilum]|uniref:bifunctional ADP-dependent NAD(P)H-hydrate dehydratase/NAD(P)H-hydrate epimerase n=1 Tax=Corynebacterium glyciniphilum TaxID=1404244 RepID=UPI003DA00E41
MNSTTIDTHLRAQVYTVEQIRRAEQPLLDLQTEPDQLMRSAASAVVDAAEVMLKRKSITPAQTKVLLAVGAGGNGGDALYAGAALADQGWPVEAVLLGRDRHAHARALDAFQDAGGVVVDLQGVWRTPAQYLLVIDGVLGMGGDGGLGENAAVLFSFISAWFIPVLSIDVPSGIGADSGSTPPMIDVDDPLDPYAAEKGLPGMTVLMRERVPAHVIADVTVTFGGLRRAHAVNAYCGQVMLANPGLEGGRSGTIGAQLAEEWKRNRRGKGALDVRAGRAVVQPRDPRSDPETTAGPVDLGGEFDFSSTALTPVPTAHAGTVRAPGPYDDKYSGGVVGICAGSETYPGAAILTTTAAVRTTSAMVRYVGGASGDVVQACPEVVWAPSVSRSGRVQAWVVGPGRGTGAEAAEEVETLLKRPEPLVVDADALTVLAEHKELRDLLAERGASGSNPAPTILTPHAGEFRRLADAVGGVPDPDDDRIGAAASLSRALSCVVLLKGRHTVVTDGEDVQCTDAGTSWAATPGSGDVLSGMIGALLAENEARHGPDAEQSGGRSEMSQQEGRVSSAKFPANDAVALHAIAASISAQTPEGEAPTSASRIAEAVPRARATAGRPHSRRAY